MACEPADALRRAARARLKAAGAATPELDARLLLQHAGGLTHEQLIADPARPVEAEGFLDLVARRAAGEPVARILGWREFYGRRFEVTPAVLDPRPDTETLIEAALAEPFQRLLDLGCGSGAIAVTLLAERPDATGTATDISPAALAVAAANAAAHAVAGRLRLQPADWFTGVAGTFDLIVSNPPYIPAGEIAGLAREVREHDPLTALAGGEDGLAAYRSIAAGAGVALTPAGRVLVEIGAGQAAAVQAIFARQQFAPAAARPDLAGHIRVLAFRHQAICREKK